MLTKNDLQAIKGLIQGEVDPLKKSVAGLRDDVSGLQKDVMLIKQQVKPIKSMQKDVRKIKNDIEGTIDHFDKRDLRLQKRMRRAEEHLKLPPLQN